MKLKLFRVYGSSFYGCNLGGNFTDTCHCKLVVAYKLIFRHFMKCLRLGTTAQMLVWNIDPYAVINHKLAFGFRMQVLLCDNVIVQSSVNPPPFTRNEIK